MLEAQLFCKDVYKLIDKVKIKKFYRKISLHGRLFFLLKWQYTLMYLVRARNAWLHRRNVGHGPKLEQIGLDGLPKPPKFLCILNQTYKHSTDGADNNNTPMRQVI